MEYKEYGFWKEHGKGFEDFPEVNGFTNQDINKSYQIDKLIAYLQSGGIYCATSGVAFMHAFTKEKFSGSFLIKTDGVWSWPEDLLLYVKDYNVIIPKEWYEYIESTGFKISQAIKSKNPDVDWG